MFWGDGRRSIHFPAYKHYAVRNARQLPAGHTVQHPGSRAALVQQTALGHSGALSRRPEQSAKVSTGAAADRVAGSHTENNHRSRNVSGNIREYYEPVYQLYDCGPGKDQINLYSPRQKAPCPYQSGPSRFRARRHKQYEGKYRTLSGGSGDRGIPGSKERTRVSDHLFQPGIDLTGQKDVLTIMPEKAQEHANARSHIFTFYIFPVYF